MRWNVNQKSAFLRYAANPSPETGPQGNAPSRPTGIQRLGLAALWSVTWLLLSGCGQDPIRVYRAPKEIVGRALNWKLPEGWKEETPGQMRVASFSIQGEGDKSAEVSIIPMPRITGRDTEFVNLWREQLRLKPIAKEELGGFTTAVEIGGEQGQMFDLIGEEKTANEPEVMRILAATVTLPSATWFVKMTGASELVGARKSQFVEFLRSLELPAKPPEGTLASGPQKRPPASGGARDAESAQPSQGSADQELPHWEVPATWKQKQPGSMLLASFSIPNEEPGTQVTVSALMGDGGGLLLNVNRWRRLNLGLPEISAGELSKVVADLELPSGKATLVDMAHDAKRLLAVVQKVGARTWFYKLLSTEKIVAAEQESFMNFVKSVRYAGN